MQLSGGQRQRVAIGRALVRDVDVFLFDEPLSNLDAKLRAELRVEIKRLHQRLGNTMIYVTHDQIEAMTLADRIAVMKGGVIQQLDEPLTIYNEPINRYVAGFIGSPSMNFIKAKIGGTAKAPLLNLMVRKLDVAELRVRWRSRLLAKTLSLAHGRNTSICCVARMARPRMYWTPQLNWLNPWVPITRLAGTWQPEDFQRALNPARHFKTGEKVGLQFRVEHASLFDAASGDRL